MRRCKEAWVGLGLVALFLTGTGLPAGAAPSSRFGLNGTKAFAIPDEPERVAQRLAWMRQLGVTHDRNDLWWATVEPQRGRFDFRRADAVFQTFERAGIQWYPILCYGAAWFPTGQNVPLTPTERADFAAYVERTVRRYRGRAPVWSLWNEPNILPFWAPQPRVEQYVDLLKAVAPGFRRADPHARLAAPVVAPLGPWDRTYVERFFSLGAGPLFDVFDYHFYRGQPLEEDIASEIHEIQAVMARYRAVKPIWISESGVTSIGLTPEQQAATLVRQHLTAFAEGVERIYYFDLQNWYDDRPDQWDSQLGLVTAAGDPKPAFRAYQTLVRQADLPVGIIGRLPHGENGLQQVLMHDPRTGRYRLALWTTLSRPVPLAVDLAEGRATLTTLSGRTQDHGNGPPRTLHVEVTSVPAYLDGVDPQPLLALAGTRVASPLVLLSPGQSIPLTVHLDPALQGARTRLVVNTLDPQLAVSRDHRRMTLRADALRSADLRPTLTGTVQVTWKGKTVPVPFRVVVEPVTPVTLQLRPFGPAHGPLTARVTVTDGAGTARRGTATLVTETTRRRLTPPYRVAPFGTASVEAAWPEPPLPRPEGRWTVEASGTQSAPVRTTALDYRLGEPVVDARLDDWVGVPTLRVGDALTQTLITPLGVSFAATVTDALPTLNPGGPMDLWRGDGFELFLGLGGPTDRLILDRTQDFQLGFAPRTRDGGPSAFWFHQDQVPAGSRVTVRTTTTGYVLEGTIPWAGLGVSPDRIGPGRWWGFDVKWNDKDPGEPVAPDAASRFTVWNGGGMNWINPSLWGIARTTAASDP